MHIVRRGLFTLYALWGSIVLVATRVDIVRHSEKYTLAIAAFAILGPLENIEKSFVLLRLGGTKNENSATALRGTFLTLHRTDRLRDVAIFRVAHSDEAAR